MEESNRIEGITVTSTGEVAAHDMFLGLEKLAISNVEWLRDIMQPSNERLRDSPGLDVWIGGRPAPGGGPEIRVQLEKLLHEINRNNWTPYVAHQKYEHLHPMTDGNGRTGRAIWLWMQVRMGFAVPNIGFLHTWYYQSLQEIRGKNDMDRQYRVLAGAKSMSEFRRLVTQLPGPKDK